MAVRVIEIKRDVFSQTLRQRKLRRVIVRLSKCSPRRQGRVLRVDENVGNQRNWRVVPLRLAESVIGESAGDAPHTRISDTLIGPLRRGQLPVDAQHTEG